MNTVRANITSSRYAETNSIFQYDTGRKLEIYGCNLPKSVEVQFSTDKEKGNTITRVGNTNNGVTTAIIPNQLLNDSEKTSNFCIFAFLYNVDNDGGRTEYVIKIPVVARPKPENPSEEPLPEPNIFHETVVAVNASAERAEKAVSDAENIRDNLNLDLSEKITRPQTAEVGQVLAVKEIDESGTPTVFEAEDVKVPTKTSELENDSGFLTEHQDISGKLDKDKLPEAIDDALTQAKESGEFNGKDGPKGEPGPKGDPGETTYIENPYDDTEIKKKIAAKVGYSEVVGNQLLMYADDTKKKLLATLELPSSVEDVHINGESIVQDGIAKIPIAKNQILGLAQPTSRYRISQRTPDNVNGIYANQYISNSSLDAAVVAAMCDGKGAAWTADEQAAARERMGLYGKWQLKSSFALESPVAYIDILDNLESNEVYIEGSDFLLCNADGTPISGSSGMSFAVNDTNMPPIMLGNMFGTQYKTNFYAYIKRIKNVILIAVIYGNTSVWQSSGNILSTVRTLRGDRRTDDTGKIYRVRIANPQYNTYRIQSGATVNVYTR